MVEISLNPGKTTPNPEPNITAHTFYDSALNAEQVGDQAI